MTDRIAVLVVRFGALGDVVLTTPLLRALRRAHPDAAITYVTKQAWAPVLAGHPCISALEALAPGDSVRTLAARLRHTAWNVRIDLHDSLRSRVLRLLVGGRWDTWRRPRWRRALRVWGGVHPSSAMPSLADQFCAVPRSPPVTPDGRPPAVVPSAADEQAAGRLAPPAPFVVLVPGAGHATKRWPGGHWDRLTQRLRRDGWPVVVAGTRAERVLLAADGVLDACGIGLGPTTALLRRASVVVAGDTGLMHLATAVGTPVVALYGPTSTDLGYRPHGPATVLQRDLPCRPCSVYGSRHCPMRHHRCMIEITPEEVADAVRTSLA